MSLLNRSPLAAVEELVRMTTALSTERGLDRQLEIIAASARRLTGADAARIHVLDQTKRFLYPRALEGAQADDRGDKLSPISITDPGDNRDPHPLSFCCASGRIVNLADIYRYTGFDCQILYDCDARHGRRTCALLAAPLRNHREETIGVLELVNYRSPRSAREPGFPDQLEAAVGALAAQAAVAVNQVQLIEENARLIDTLNRSNHLLEAENRRLRRCARAGIRHTLIGESPAMQRVFGLMEKVVDTDVTVLVRGETGTGKDVVATAIHRNGPRKDEPFIAQNCAAVPEGLLESELFGHRRGAFTGAQEDRQGLFEQAHRGTLFLDEIGDMPPGLQAKLLRFLEDGEVRPLGSNATRRVNVRVIAATNADLERKIAAGDFREDLYYRLSVFPVELPPLRDRPEDLIVLVHHFIGTAVSRLSKEVTAIAPAALDALMRHTYPGNVRELSNIVERAVLLCEPGGSILVEHLPATLTGLNRGGLARPLSPIAGNGLTASVQHFELALIERTLAEHGGNQTQTARALCIPQRTLNRKIHKYGILQGMPSTRRRDAPDAR